MLDIYLLTLGSSVILCALTAWGSKMLDDMMDYGNILDFVRLQKAKKAACKVGFHEFENIAEGIVKEAPDFDTRANKMNELFWDVVMKNKSFKLWMCPMCMSIRASVILVWGQMLLLSAYYGLYAEFLLLPLVNAIITYKFVR